MNREQIEKLKEKRERLSKAITQTETRIESLEESRQKILDEMNKLGVTPENIDEKLQKLKARLAEETEKAEAVLDQIEL